MALRQVLVPWVPGYDIGVGADLASGSPMGKVVEGEATPTTDARGAQVAIEVRRIEVTEDVERSLGIDAEASGGFASFGAGAKARFTFAQNSKVHSDSLFMAISVQIELAFESIADPAVGAEAVKIIGRTDEFRGRYGNMFVRGLGRGGLFLGMLQVNTSSEKEATDIAASLKGSYGLFSAEAESKFREVQNQYQREVYCSMYWEGGPITGIGDPSSPVELLTHANSFLGGFQDKPDAYARPFYVALAPITIARGPLPPNAADAEHAQDILTFCAKRRSALLDQLNLLEFILENPSKFDYSNGADENAIRQATSDLQDDLDLIASCASAAINQPVGAAMPDAYAIAEGRTFPKAKIPDPLPIGQSGKAATVSTGGSLYATRIVPGIWQYRLNSLANLGSVKVTPSKLVR